MPASIQAIVSVTDDWAIGRQGRLAVRNRQDMLRFKELTTGHTVVMGRRTLDTLPGGRPLAERRNIVLTRDDDQAQPGVELAHGIREVKQLLRPDERVWVIGGESVYRALLPCCQQCLVTLNHVTSDHADAWFPNLDEHPAWRLMRREPGGVTDQGVPFEYLTYRRVL